MHQNQTSEKYDALPTAKGGVTSGVVYPRTMRRLAQKFRFRNIGGTSAGALAGALAAAAEHQRRTVKGSRRHRQVSLRSDKFSYHFQTLSPRGACISLEPLS